MIIWEGKGTGREGREEKGKGNIKLRECDGRKKGNDGKGREDMGKKIIQK